MLRGIGKSISRSEDNRFLSGGGKFTDDFVLPGMVRAVLVRSPYAAAKIHNIDISDSLNVPGVIGVYTAREIGNELGNIPCFGVYKRSDGSPMFVPPRPVLAKDRVLFVGDPVAVIVGKNISIAKMAAEILNIEYEETDAVVDLQSAFASDSVSVWPDCPDNVSFTFTLGNKERVEHTFKEANKVVSLEYRISRVYAAPMEPRAAVGTYDTFEDRYTLYSGTQGPHNLRRVLAQKILNIPEGHIRVVSPDMGGAFGMRSSPYPEMALVLWIARKLGCPVKWTADRMEGFVGDEQARDNVTSVSLALSSENKFLALKVNTLAALGGYLSTGGASPPTVNLGGLAGVYTTPAIYAQVNGVFTNTAPTSPYRGAGRPEASFAIERVIDEAAYQLDVDPAELRRKNIIPISAMPYKTGLVFEYDSGDFQSNLDKALETAKYKGFPQRREISLLSGHLRGFGIANVIERSAGMGEETAELRVDSSGSITLLMGTHSHGQGHETIFKQLVSEKLGTDWNQIHFVQGDTDIVAHGFGTFGSRSSGLGGAALDLACTKILDKAKEIAAYSFESSTEDIIFEKGNFKIVGTDKVLSWKEICHRAYRIADLPQHLEPGLNERAVYVPRAPTFPNGCHCAEVEIDSETGHVDVVRYTVVDDVGTVLNPLLLKGQIHGGIVQGIGQILMEQIVYDDDTGQLITGSFMDYCMPRASDLPFFSVHSNPVPTTVNPLGVKGAGEAGTVGALPALMNAIFSALSPLGIREVNMPANPERIWRAIRKASLDATKDL